jgi:hypothetical protein
VAGALRRSSLVATVTGHGWDAAIRNLRPGRHVIIDEAELVDGTPWSFTHTVIVVPKHAAHVSG